MNQRNFSRVVFLALLISILVVSQSYAEVGPVTSVETDNPPGSPPYNLLSISTATYTVTADQFAPGTTTWGGIGGVPLPFNDDYDINTALDWQNHLTDIWTINFGGGLWTNTNGDNPDFFLFEYGGTQTPTIAAIMPDGSLGQTVIIPDQWRDLGYVRDGAAAGDLVSGSGTGQSLEGMSWAITDMLDGSGAPLTNNSVILGISIVDRGGVDPTGFFAVVPPPGKASGPQPARDATDVIREISLDWTAGKPAVTHDVYFSTNRDDVANGSPDALVSAGQSDTGFDPDGRLEFGQTYHWRVDEVNTAHADSPWTGDVWSFTVEPFSYPVTAITATASSSFGASTPEKTIDGSGLVDDLHSSAAADMWISAGVPATLEYAFDRAYKLHELWIWNSNQLVETFVGFGGKDVVIEYSLDGENWSVLEGVEPLTRAPGADGYAHNNTIDFGGAVAQHVRLTINTVQGIAPQASLSEVRFFFIPTYAREAEPASGSIDVAPDTHLSWRPGREAASHDIYLGTDASNLPLVGSVSESSFDTAALDLQLGETYAWQIAEVNGVETPGEWKSEVLSFSTADTIVVDDMERYKDAEFLEIWATWVDGFEDPGNGSLVGNGAAGTPETGFVHGGSQSLPIHYDNSGAPASEAEQTFSPAQDWTRAGVQTLVLFFSGDPGNTGGQVYVSINGVKVTFDGDADALNRPFWTQWNIDLSTVGTNLSSVTSLAVGVEGAGSGTLLVDDIRLYKEAPALAQEVIWIEGEATDTQGSLWKITDDATASGGRYFGSADGDGDDNTDPPGPDWHATYKFSVSGGTYTIGARLITAPGNSFWFRIAGATSPQLDRPDGWINTNPMDNGDAWHWDDIVVEYTLAAGEHTLEVAKREDGTLLDALVITRIGD